jgi:hypothetical protein
MLLLARLVTDDIRSLWSPVAPNSVPQRDCLPLDYGRRLNLKRKRIEKEAIESALNAAKGKLKVAAELLGLSFYTLAVVLRHYHIHLPLSTVTSKRIGAKRIAGVREALVQGVRRNEIQRLYGIAELSILLIELDRPELYYAHREASVIRKREKYRGALLSFLRDSPSESRRVFKERNSAAYRWLGKHDRPWLNSHLPESRQGQPGRGKRKTLKDWQPMDQAAFLGVRQAARQELAKPDRPVRLTRSRLLSDVGGSAALSQSRRLHYPSATAEAERLAETKKQFLTRALRWAIRQLAEQKLVVSINRLIPLVSASPKELKEHRNYIIIVAAEFEIAIDGRSLLAP